MTCNACGRGINSEDEFKAGICSSCATLAVICGTDEAPQAKTKHKDEFHNINRGLDKYGK